MKKLTYKKAGVDIQAGEDFARRIKSISRKITPPRDLSFKAFSSILDPRPHLKDKDSLFVFSADGVGTKLKIAQKFNIHDTVGIDLVAMNVNDIVCCGSKPLVFMDYIAYGKVKDGVLDDIIRGIGQGCWQAGCYLLGGETAQMPAFYKKGEYDLAGFCMGVVPRKNLIRPSSVRSGDIVLGFPSNGLHSNGFSLVRKVFKGKELKNNVQELLRPTRIYVKEILVLLGNKELRSCVKGIAHITGGGFHYKATKILPPGLTFSFMKGSWKIPSVFEVIKRKAGIDDKEMFSVFNMGIGMMIVVAARKAQAVERFYKKRGVKIYTIGKVIKGKNVILEDK